MRAVIQRVSSASVSVGGAMAGEISRGYCILLGIHREDTDEDLEWMVSKVTQLRVFEDSEGKMNLSLIESGGAALVVSQFTLYADCRKGRRPGFTDAARPELAIPLYEAFCQRLRIEGVPVATGVFGAKMAVSLVNDGPVTVIIDSPPKTA
jgi:D-tyrosyl-tRNA(Tyr) deacylase